MIDSRKIRSITICSSSKFYPTARRLADEIQKLNLTVYTPRFEYDESHVAVSSEQKMDLTRDFLQKIAKSDAIFVLDEGGYTGRSVCIETGYAAALGKVVLLAEPPSEGAIMALADHIVPVEELRFFLEGPEPLEG